MATVELSQGNFTETIPGSDLMIVDFRALGARSVGALRHAMKWSLKTAGRGFSGLAEEE